MNVFADIYKNNGWKNQESASGNGSTLDATKHIRAVLPVLFEKYRVRSVLDIPCGDMNWASQVFWPEIYIGADVVPELIEANRRRWPGKDFREIDIAKNPLPCVDLILVRDLFGHLPNHKIQAALRNIKHSGARYLLATTFPNYHGFDNIDEGDWRPVNLDEFWGLPHHVEIINEQCDISGFEDKSLGLWELR